MATRVEAGGEKWIEVEDNDVYVKLTVVHSPSSPYPGQRMVLRFTSDDGEILANAIRTYSKVAAREKER